MTSYWIFQEFDGKPIRVDVKKGTTPDEALAREFKHHEKFRNESPRDTRALRDFLPEVTPGVLRLFSEDGTIAWSSEPSDMKFGPASR